MPETVTPYVLPLNPIAQKRNQNDIRVKDCNKKIGFRMEPRRQKNDRSRDTVQKGFRKIQEFVFYRSNQRGAAEKNRRCQKKKVTPLSGQGEVFAEELQKTCGNHRNREKNAADRIESDR